MASVGDTTLALVGAFSFGLVVNAALAALFLYFSGHGGGIFRDSQRLVLITFLLSAALWAQSAFISTALAPTAAMPCQITVIFTTIFDQFGRFSVEQFLLWAINSGSKSGPAQIVLQVVLVGRFILGAVFVGLSRPSFDPVCVPISSVLPVAAAVTAVDGVLILALAAKAISAGLVSQVRESKPDASRSKAILGVIFGFIVWTGTSISMLIGYAGMNLLLRSTVPAIGLLILIFIVTVCADSLAKSQPRPPRAPESPGAIISGSRDISTSGSTNYPPSRYEDLKAQQNPTVTMFAQPRAAPQPRTALPNISAANGGTGVGGVPVQGQLFPAPRAVVAPTLQQKRTATGLRKPGSTGKIVISNPIIDESNREMNPLAKIPTIDLQTAARMERERRNTDLRLVAPRPAPQPPTTMPLEERVKRSTSVKRKEVASVISMKAQAGPVPDTLEPEMVARTTSAQLSPGVEELRRRSPRQPPPAPVQVEDSRPITPPPKSPLRPKSRVLSPKTPERQVQAVAVPAAPQRVPVPPAVPQAITPPKTPSPKTPNPKTPTPKTPMTPQQRQLARQTSIPPIPDIRPSRQLPASPKTPPPEPTKTPLQRRPTNGLPGNPRAMAVKGAQAKTPGAETHQTIMFVNNIVYNDPQIVESIINGAMPPKTGDLESASSVLNRPRPIPRTSEKNLYPADKQPSPRTPSHRRTKSGGSVMSRKSTILQSQAGSPTQLPPLPPPPKSAGSNPAQRPAPNSSRSMTFDEKMVMFYPGQPGSENGGKRRSSVPELPALPAQFTTTANVSDEGRMLQSHMSRSTSKSTKRSTQHSTHTESIFEADEILPSPRRTNGAYMSVSDDIGGSWLPGIAPDSRITQDASVTAKRASSPLLGAARYSNITSSTEGRTDADTMTNWGSVHSPAAAVQIQWGQVPQETYINRADPASMEQRPSYLEAAQPIGERETMTFMLDASQEHEREPCTKAVMTKLESSPQSQWHRRVGDEVLTFSGRKEVAGLRKMPPPKPLVLGPPSTKNPVIIKAAELSPQESPGHALRAIQSQLKKFEEPSMAVFESPRNRQTRMTLLNDLEKEMDMQAGQWQKQHENRDSTSTLMTSTTLDLDSRPGSMMSTKDIGKRASARRSHLMSGSSTSKSIEGSTGSGSIQSSWQRRLAEAQSEYMDNAEQLNALRNTSTNFLNMSMAQLGSPTPPDSNDSEIEFELERSKSIAALSALTYIPQPPAAKKAPAAVPSKHLWTPAPRVPEHVSVWLWSSQHSAPAQRSAHAELPGLAVRPAQRKEANPLTIQSNNLWRMPMSNKRMSDASGLWKAPHSRPQSTLTPSTSTATPVSTRPISSQLNDPAKKPRPVTVKPPRRQRRVTLLPDIVEDPQPLPDKRDTLGIFQFPWGEKSDTATVQPRTTMMAMPGTMSSGGQMALNAILQARARQIEADEYSSSFFDDYDDDEEYDDSDDDEDEDEDEDEGDDTFDETTLWEIASLLKTENVPSKNSLLPPALPGSIVDDYLAEGSSTEQSNSEEADILIALEEEPTRPLALANNSRELEQVISPKLWGAQQRAVKTKQSVGLPQPDSQAWERYAGTRETLRTKPRPSEPAAIVSSALWSNEVVQEAMVGPAQALDLWVAGAAVEAPRRSRFMERGIHGQGVGQPDHAVWQRYDTEKETVRSKPRPSEPALIVSSALWSNEIAQEAVVQAGRTLDLWAADAAVEAGQTPDLWVAGAAVEAPRLSRFMEKGIHGQGVGQPDHAVWQRYDTEKETVRSKPRLVVDAGFIVSEDLWVASPVHIDAPSSAMWTAAATKVVPKQSMKAEIVEEELISPKTSKVVQEAKQMQTSLWTPPTAVSATTENKGMFRIEPKQADTRTTDEQPAAVSMIRKARSPSVDLPLEQLTSTTLWSPTPAADDEAGWMAMFSKKADVANPWWEKGADKTTTPPRVRASRPDLLRAPRPSDSVPRRWAAELAEAIAASYPRMVRPDACNEWWDAELATAVAASYPRLPRPIATAEMWASALAEAMERSHPFDSARFHPVFAFFGDLTLTCDIASVHPAIAPYVAVPAEDDEIAFDLDESAQRGVEEEGQNSIMAQIAALEAEREFAERAVRDASFAFEHQRTTSVPALSSDGDSSSEDEDEEPLVPAIPAMWAATPQEDLAVDGMWAPSSLPPVPRVPSMIIGQQEDAEAEKLRRSRRMTTSRAAEVDLVQADGDAQMWNKEKWQRQERGKSIVMSRGWLGEEEARRASRGVVLRYD